MVLEDLIIHLKRNGFAERQEDLNKFLSSLTLYDSESGVKRNREDDITDNVKKGTDKVKNNSTKERAEVIEEKKGIPADGSWIITASRGVSTLHVMSNCYRIPGINYKNWTVVAEPVAEGSFRKACKTCFPRGYPVIEDGIEEEVDGEMKNGMPRELALNETSDSDSSSSS